MGDIALCQWCSHCFMDLSCLMQAISARFASFALQFGEVHLICVLFRWLPWLAAAALVCGSWSPNQMRVQFRRSMDVNTRGSHKIQCLKSIRYPSQAGRALVLFVVASIANSKIRFRRFGGREFNAAKSGAIHYRIGSNGSNFRLVLF